jgi:hypothetical protein
MRSAQGCGLPDGEESAAPQRGRAKVALQLHGERRGAVAERAQAAEALTASAAPRLHALLEQLRTLPSLRERQPQALAHGLACLACAVACAVLREAPVHVTGPAEVVLVVLARPTRKVNEIDRAGRVERYTAGSCHRCEYRLVRDPR